MLTGTIINALAIVVGSAAGLLLKAGGGFAAKRFPSLGGGAAGIRLGERLQDIIMKGVALCVLYIGISGCLKGSNTLAAILSMVLGAIIGELLDLDRRMQSLGDWVQEKTAFLSRGDAPSTVSEGFVTASLLFCVGAMAIVGSLENGLTGNYDTLKAKAMLDGISAVVFASSLGIGVMFSAVAVFVYQGLISVLASFISPFLGDAVVAEMTCVGSLLIVALSLNMLGVTKIKVMNLVPAILLPILLCRFM
jgi:uncharacterized membrane protein YqgA involved in biofilm formation